MLCLIHLSWISIIIEIKINNIICYLMSKNKIKTLKSRNKRGKTDGFSKTFESFIAKGEAFGFRNLENNWHVFCQTKP